MESNGKAITSDGSPAKYTTGTCLMPQETLTL